MDAPRRESARRFAAAGDEDLRVARLCLAADPPAGASAAFHAQQAAEKYLKAWLVALGVDEPPLTHSLVQLGEVLAKRSGERLADQPLAFLSGFAVAPRYGIRPVTVDDARQALGEAEALVAVAVAALSALGCG